MHRRECRVSHVGPKVSEDTIADLVYECCNDDPQYRVGRTSNSTIVKFASEGSDVHAAKLAGRASGYVAPGGEPYKFTKIPVTMSIDAVWKHLKAEMSVLAYSRSTRDAIKGRLNDDKRPEGKRQVDDLKNGVHQAGVTFDVWRLMITPHIVKQPPGRLTTSGRPNASVVETRGTWPRIAPRRRTCATIASGLGTWLKTARSRSKMVRVSAMHVTGLVPRVNTGSGEKPPTRTRRTPTRSPTSPTRSAGSARRPTMGGVSAPNGWSTALPASTRESRRSTTIPLVNSPLTRGTRSEGGHRPTPLWAVTVSWGG